MIQSSFVHVLSTALPTRPHISSAGVVYRDLKLENILHRKNQRMVVLADFGLSKNLPAGASTKTICGTIQ